MSGASSAAIVALLVGAGIGATALLLRESGYSRPAMEPLGDAARCAAYDGLPPGWGANPHAGMVRIAGGEFQLGSERGYAEEKPVVSHRVESFWIDRTEVSNAQFAAFVAATGYVTEAERGSGAVTFHAPAGSEPPPPNSWWKIVQDVDWRHPEGPGSSIDQRANQPVVAVTLADAQAYARWLGRALPDEVQWEYAAKAGRSNEDADASLRDAQGKPLANFWQGFFPLEDKAQDGYAGRAPVGCFTANPAGLYDMIGNVWEWTTDPWNGGAGHDSRVPDAGADLRVIKGGSYLCADNYCVRARASSRQGQEANLPTVHLGFRTVLSENS